jgi:CRISPR-associated protein Cmr3
MMDETVSIIFSVVEPMLFRGPGEFDPYAKGVYSRAMSRIMPSPSTVAGTLATYCITKLNKPLPINSKDWIEQYLLVLGDDIRIKGPILYLNNEFMVEGRTLEILWSIDSLKQKCEIEYNKLVQKIRTDRLSKYLVEEKKEKCKVYIKKDVRTGVRLETRKETRNVEEGEKFLYNIEYVDYINYPAKILIELRGSLVKELSSIQPLPVRFGGENRVAILSSQSGAKILDEIKRKLWNNIDRSSGVLALYLATPAIFKEDKKIEEHIKEFVENKDYEYLGLSGESMILGAGFSIGERKRKPIYKALEPGSIIFVKGEFNLIQLYIESALGEATQLGYGTFIPVPLSDQTFTL